MPPMVPVQRMRLNRRVELIFDRKVHPLGLFGPPVGTVSRIVGGWTRKKAQVFAGKHHIPDSEDPDTVNHMIWYETTGFTRPYPGEKTVRPASDFNRKAPASGDVDD